MSAIHAPKKKYFTVQQANAMLPLLRLILRDITTLAQRLREQNRRLARLHALTRSAMLGFANAQHQPTEIA